MTQPGDRAPACYGVGTNGVFYSLEEQYGRAVVLILAGYAAAPKLSGLMAEFHACQASFGARDADVLLLVDDNPSLLGLGDGSAIRTIDAGDFLGRCGVGVSGSAVLVLDRNMRIVLRSNPSPTVVADCLACLDALPREAAHAVSQPAPAIVLPHLLPRDLCRSLIDRFESSPTIDGEVARIDAAGNARSVVDHAKKYRRDMPIAEHDALHQMLSETLLSRCAPEIAKAFQARIAHVDRILVSRYDAQAGWFRRHRDNTADNVAFREWALSLNLNTGDYEGGHLLFPEYNNHRYAPPTGGGLIFSTSVLHEAAPVTLGRRYVLLTFFHSEAAEARRQAYFAKT